MIDIDAALDALSLDQKCRLVAGQTNWRTKAYPEAGIPQLKMSDGPTGIRGEGHGSSGTPGVAVPAGITLGASWDPDLLGEIGDLLGKEAVRKRAHVLLGPTVNLHRTPVGGRTFECYSEDPELSGVLAASYIRSVQDHDVAVTVKHFVCNDTEIERLTVDVQIDDQTLRELYLRPFELAVRDGGAWGVMSAYNRVNGPHAAEHRGLLTDILRTEWGFDGYVVSDWFGVHEPVGAANAGLTLEMPAPVRVYGSRLGEAVERGDVTEETVDGLVRDLLTVMNRTRADERSCDEAEQSVDDPAERALTRRAAAAGTVLLRNEAIDDAGRTALPIDPSSISTLAVVGPNAVIDRSMGGGSASLTPFGHRTLLDALTDRIAGIDDSIDISYEPGVRIDRLTPIVRGSRLRTPDGRTGWRLEYVEGTDWTGPTIKDTITTGSMLRFFGTTPDEVDPLSFSARVSGSFIPDRSGRHTIGVVSTGPVIVTVSVGGTEHTVVDDPRGELPRTREFFGYGSEEVTLDLDLTEGDPVEVSIRWATSAKQGFAALRVGVRAPDPADLFDRAVAAAAAADVAVVVVGTNDEWETEGFDREFMDLPGRQDELVEAVSAANSNTVVVVNAGSPVTMDWAAADHASPAPAVVTSFFAGQEQAEAMVDVLLGDDDPGGRLPLCVPAKYEDHAAFDNHQPEYPADGPPVQRYAEGLFIGHRHYERSGIAPRFWFGHGLSYGSTAWDEPTVSVDEIAVADLANGPITVSVPIRNTSGRVATTVVQGYTMPVALPADRPARVLKAWAKRRLAPGESDTVELTFGVDAFRHWDAESAGWAVTLGAYDLVIATSSDPASEAHRVRVTLT
ncbi:MAG: beta-glucosidase [Ilumatobacter sp.]